jgi:CheY-like chemotaxis protein
MTDVQPIQGWFCRRGDDVVGPLSHEQLRQLAAAGELRPRDTLWQAQAPGGELLRPVRAATILRERLLSVLVVGGRGDSGRGLRALVRRLGYDARVARPGSEAVRAARLCAPAAVFLDLDAAGAEAYALVAPLQAQGGARPPVLVAVSNDGTDEARRRTRDAGFRYHLEKPADPNVLALLLALLRQERSAGGAGNGRAQGA